MKKKLLVFIVAFNAEKTIKNVLSRLPLDLASTFEVEILIIDDASLDATFNKSVTSKQELDLPFPITVLKNPINQGYGGNQKIGYHYAIDFKFDYVALIHGDGQYAPEYLPQLMAAFEDGKASAVFGSRMLSRGQALKGGMPIYKYVGNKILTAIENRLLQSNLSEFHSGYRIYKVSALKNIPFECNTNDFHFDTEIIVQLIAHGDEIRELSIPTYYGDEICHVNGMKYAWDVVMTVLRYRAQGLGIFYDRRFDVSTSQNQLANYQLKIEGVSPHTITLDFVRKGSKVVDLGCASGYVGALLKNIKACSVTGVDQFSHPNQSNLDQFIEHNLFDGPPEIGYEQYDYLLLLDIIEHVPNPEQFLEDLHAKMSLAKNTTLLVSTGNIAFFITRIMLLFGQFNYGKRGILDMTHTRLFTFASLKRILEQSGFEVLTIQGVPAPFGLATGSGFLSKVLLKINLLLIKLSKTLFSYQMYMSARARPTVALLLGNAVLHSEMIIGQEIKQG
jgi:glycosyltransferase involved in cell wall biosynthesis